MTLFGIDCSSWQGIVNWPEVARDTYTFAFCKRTEGVGYTDPTFALNWSGIRAAGLIRGCYHFAQPGQNSPQAEAAHFLAGLPALEPTDMVVLDIETPTGADHSAWALAWLTTVEHAIGYKPLCYSYLDFIQHYLTDPALAAYPLWLAAYGAAIPPAVGPWTQGAAIWQYSQTGSVAGIAGNCDLNRLDRDLAGLKALGKPAPKPPAIHYPYAARVVQPGVLKSQPSHASSAAIDKRHRPVTLHVAEKEVQVTGPAVADPNGRDWWLPCKLNAPESTIHGWYLKDSLSAD